MQIMNNSIDFKYEIKEWDILSEEALINFENAIN